MPSITEITVSQLSRLIGLPHSPAIIDIRGDEDFAADPRLIPGSQRRDFSTVASWGPDYKGQPVIIVCQEGLQLSQGAAARMRHQGFDAQLSKADFKPGARNANCSFARRSCPAVTKQTAPYG